MYTATPEQHKKTMATFSKSQQTLKTLEKMKKREQDDNKTRNFKFIAKLKTHDNVKQKPYVSSGKDGWHVLDGKGKTLKSFSKKKEGRLSAQMYLKQHFSKLSKHNEGTEINESPFIVTHDPSTYRFLVHKPGKDAVKSFSYTDAEDKDSDRQSAEKHANSLKESIIATFETWLIESATLDNDSRGKLHEILVAAHLNRLIHGNLTHADHFRDEKGRTPEEAHNNLVKGLSDASYQEAHSHAVQAAEEIHTHIKANHPELLANKEHHVKVSWTSLKSDHEKLTGKKDESHSGGADIMLSSHDATGNLHHAVGYSLKIADNKITTGQTGSKTTEQVMGMPIGSLTKHDTNHRLEVSNILKKHGHDADSMSEHQKHVAFKLSRDNTNPAGRKMADEIRASAYKHAANKVKEIKEHIGSLSDSEQKNRITEFVAPSHAFPTYQVATSPKSKTTKIKNEREDITNRYNAAGKLSYTQSEGNGNSLLVKNSEGKTLHRIEIRAKRPIGHSEILVK